jgi:diguanylate cyclase (GGDEF)-like protein
MVLDSVDHQIAVIDQQGQIQFINHSWLSYGEANGCVADVHWQSVNYLKICQAAADNGDEFGIAAFRGIDQMISGEVDKFALEYPCHSKDDYRWYMMQVSRSSINKIPYFIIIHQDISSRKKAEVQAIALAQLDGLTNIANRRRFDEFLKDEWNRCKRLHQPISLLMMDIDFFKRLNDDYGHQTGDTCLKQLSKALSQYAKRPGDICARYGGEEFVIVLSNTANQDALKIGESILQSVVQLNFPNKNTPMSIVTVSIGLATMTPQNPMSCENLIKAADEQLYHAKDSGRNQICLLDMTTSTNP